MFSGHRMWRILANAKCSSPLFGNNACDELHCLPVARLMQRIELKVAIFAFSVLNGLAPSYLIDLAVCISITQTRSSLFT